MATHNLSRATDGLFAGDVYYARYHTGDTAKSGLPVDPPIWVNFGAPAAIDTNALIAAATSTELPNAATTTYTTATSGTSPLDDAGLPATATIQDSNGVSRSVWVLDVPRAITGTMTHGTSVVASSMIVSGFDVYCEPMTELFTFTATGTSKSVAGKKAFKYILSYAITAAGDATANTLNVGWNDVIGLPFRFDNKNRVIPLGNGALDASATLVVADDTSPATNATGDVRGTVDFATASDGTKLFAAVLYPPSRSDRTLAFGVAQV